MFVPVTGIVQMQTEARLPIIGFIQVTQLGKIVMDIFLLSIGARICTSQVVRTFIRLRLSQLFTNLLTWVRRL